MATKTEVERLSVVETKVDRAVADIAEVKTAVTDGFATINTKIDNLDKKYAAKWVQTSPNTNYAVPQSTVAVNTPTAGLNTYTARAKADAGTITVKATSTAPAYLLVELV